MKPFSLNLAMAARLVKSVAAFREKPTTASIFAWMGVASNVAVNGTVCSGSGVFVQPVAALWTQLDAWGTIVMLHTDNEPEPDSTSIAQLFTLVSVDCSE